jgi:hypothetical protein
MYQDEFSGYSHTELTLDGDTQFSTSESSFTLENLSEGIHILNLTLFDRAGNFIFEVIEFRIDLTNPVITSLAINEHQSIWPDLNVVWSVFDISDYRSAEVSLDGELIAVVFSPECSLLIENSEFGEHIVNVTIFDWINRTDSFVLSIRIPNPGVQYMQLVAGCIGVTVVIIVGWRRIKH